MLKFKIIFACFFAFNYCFAQNPISPTGVYIADPTARLWNDGKLWVYGSLDKQCNRYCSTDHYALSTSNMKDWKLHENIFASKGNNDEVSYNDNALFAPDIMYRNGTYYLYYCQPGNNGKEGVATSSNPEGPFVNGEQIDLGGHEQIDPSIFIDDDGETYYLWGQFSLKMAKMKPDMKTLDLTTLIPNVINEKEHFFHEGAFMTKRNGLYYLVYADMSRADMPTSLGYATSKSPFGPYTYRGVIINNSQSNPVFWNNHGSIAEFQNQWYVFYHRPTNSCKTMRKACVEPINFKEDGSIDEVEMTSQGANGPLDACKKIQAEWACLLFGANYITYDSNLKRELLTNLTAGSRAVYKYIDFKTGVKTVTIKVKGGKKEGAILLKADKPWHKTIATITVPANELSKDTYQEITVPVNTISDVHAMYLIYKGNEENDISIDWIQFGK